MLKSGYRTEDGVHWVCDACFSDFQSLFEWEIEMLIYESNGKVINTKQVYIHDDILLYLAFDRNKKILKLTFSKHSDRLYIINFINVIGFTMTSCDFWGASEYVLDFEYIEPDKRTLIPSLEKQWMNVPDSSSEVTYDDFLETLLTFSSGDRLRIACEAIEIQ